MAKLADIAAGKIAGMAPTPVEQYTINTYFSNDQLFNIMEWSLAGMGTTGGNIAASYVNFNDNTDGVGFRALGSEYTTSNATPEPTTVYLKYLGGSYNVDRGTTRALKNGGIDVWKEAQVAQKTTQIKSAFAKYFISGDTVTNTKEFNGVYKSVFATNASQELEAFELPGGLTQDKALELEEYFNKAMSKMYKRPTCVITTRTGASLAKTLNAYRNMFTGVVDVDNIKYDQLLGMPIVEVDDTHFPTEATAKGLPFLFVYISEIDGVRTAIPVDGNVLDIIDPDMGDGTLVKTGAIEMMCAPIFGSPKSVAVCYVDRTPAV